MIAIDKRKLDVPTAKVVMQDCKDGSIRLIKYSTVEEPKELLKLCSPYSWQRTTYSIEVNLPAQRVVEILATVAHTSQNCWQVIVSSLGGSSCISYKTLGEVNELLKGLFT